MPAERSDGTGRIAASGAGEGEPGCARRAFRRHRARIQEFAGHHLRLRADDSQRNEGDVGENAQRIIEQTRALAHVVTEFLKFARPLELSNEEVALNSLVERAIEEVRDAMPEVEISVDGRDGAEFWATKRSCGRRYSIWCATPPRRPETSRSGDA